MVAQLLLHTIAAGLLHYQPGTNKKLILEVKLGLMVVMDMAVSVSGPVFKQAVCYQEWPRLEVAICQQ